MNSLIRVTVVRLLGIAGLFGGVLIGCGFAAPIRTGEYASPSKQFVLQIEPRYPENRGQAHYRLLHHNREVWNKTLPYTLAEAHVLNDGSVVGYAYTAGWSGRYGDRWSDHGDLVFAILDPEGNIRIREAYQRALGRQIMTDQPPEPFATAIVADPDNDRVVFLETWNYYDFGRPATTAWRVYQLSTGKPLGLFYPEEKMKDAKWLRPFLVLRPLPGTPLLIAQWFRVQIEGTSATEIFPISMDGTHFALLDGKCNPVWQLVLPDDYEGFGDEEQKDKLSRWVRDKGAVLSTDSPGRFDLYFAKEYKRVSFIAKRDAKGNWIVSEVRRRDFIPKALLEEKNQDGRR